MRACAIIIVAHDLSYGIGFQGNVAWPRLEQDMKFFAETTKDNIVIMGRKTWDSLPRKPLPERVNYVLSKTLTTADLVRKHGLGVNVFSDLENAILSAQSHFPDKKIYIIGGEQIYTEALAKHVVLGLLVTEVQRKFQCDTFMPKYPEFEKINSTDTYKQGDEEKSPNEVIRYQIHTYQRMANPHENQYLQLMATILQNGFDRPDRTGVGTKSIFGTQLTFDLENSFPLLTTKKMFLRGVFEELKWFLSGSTNTQPLKDQKITIWDHNTSKAELERRGLEYPEGELGPGYGFQWRHWGAVYTGSSKDVDYKGLGIDQLQRAIEMIQANKPEDSRRIIVNAWNVSCLDEMALPPCHMSYQFAVYDKKLCCRVDMRSADVFLGLPFNIASYALLTHIVANICRLKPGRLTIQMGDTHIYNNHLDACQLQVERSPCRFPLLGIKKSLKSLDDVADMRFEDDVVIEGYIHHPAIKAQLN